MNTQAASLAPLQKAADFRDFREFVAYFAAAYRNRNAFIIKLRKGTADRPTEYRYITYEELKKDIFALAASLISRGWEKKRIAVIGSNSYEWMLVYLAVLCTGGSIVPLDKGLPQEEFELSVSRSEAGIVFYGSGYKSYVDRLPAEVTAVPMNYEEGLSLSELLREGRAPSPEVSRRFEDISPDPESASIYIFTSGTTSMAKAVMLCQRNILSNLNALAQAEDIRSSDVNIALLPYHHTFGCTGQLLMLRKGASTVFCDGLKYIQKNMMEYGVSVFVSVPLIIESMYRKILSAAEKSGQTGKLRFAAGLSGLLMKIHIDVRRKLFRSVIDQLGGKLRMIINGAAAISPDTVKGMSAFGIETIQGYGMTEAAPVLSAENPENRRAGSIGKAIPGVKIELVEPNAEGVGELIAKGPNIMLGYMNNEEETAAVLRDGWLYTGDLAYIDDDGYIFLRGRKKNVIVLKNGKNVYPEELEDLIGRLPYVTECMVFAQTRKADDDSDLALAVRIYCEGEASDSVREKAMDDLEIINKELPKYKQIHRLLISEEPMKKTTTGKIKRYEEMKSFS